MREICMSGSMSGMWRRSYGSASEAPPHERGGQRLCQTYCHHATSRLYPMQVSTACHAFSMRDVTWSDRNVMTFVMALLSFKESTLGAYRLKASNAALLLQHPAGVSPTACGSARLAVD